MLTGNTLVFDIETVPDTVTGSYIWDLIGISDEDQAKAMGAKRLENTGYSDFIAHHLHKIVAISAALRSSDGFKIWSIGDEHSNEKVLLERFFRGILLWDALVHHNDHAHADAAQQQVVVRAERPGVDQGFSR